MPQNDEYEQVKGRNAGSFQDTIRRGGPYPVRSRSVDVFPVGSVFFHNYAGA
jgi:hypothetical protein